MLIALLGCKDIRIRKLLFEASDQFLLLVLSVNPDKPIEVQLLHLNYGIPKKMRHKKKPLFCIYFYALGRQAE